jgi:hypothetical protein
MRAPVLGILLSASTLHASFAEYVYKQGFLAAGDDLASGPYNYTGALAYCSANDLCMGFTFSLGPQNSTTPPNPVNAYFKTSQVRPTFHLELRGYDSCHRSNVPCSQNYVCCDPTWATYMKTAPPQWPSVNFTVVSADSSGHG